MLYLETGDIERLAMEVRRFLGKGDLMTRLAAMATIYLEFPDVGTMHFAHQSIIRAIDMRMIRPGQVYEYLDDHTIRLEPIAGVCFVLSCKQRFTHPMRGSVGYRDIAFQTAELPKFNQSE